MLKRTTLLFLPLFVTLLFTACEKEYSLENQTGFNSGTATYTFEGTPSNCTAYTVNGEYIAGKELDATNAVKINVNVTKVGTYTIATPTYNEVSFAAVGSFTTTGVQSVLLQGDGTPVVAKTFTYPVGTNGCTFSVAYKRPPVVIEPAVFVYKGSPGNCTEANVNGTYKVGTALDETNTVTIKINVMTPGTYSITTNTENGFTFSGSGIFTTTGEQFVTLTGTGTPITIGPMLFTPVGNGCAFVVNCFS